MLTSAEQTALDAINAALEGSNLPSFPVTPITKIDSEYFSNLWVKDESVQETGTHKDRMAWEIVMSYHAILRAKEKGLHSNPLPQFSIISAGSAALAIQTQLKKYGLPNLKILVDKSTQQNILSHLQAIGCEVYTTELDKKVLTTLDILDLTDNVNGFDITSNKAFDPEIRFYDWMAYEILNSNPEYVFIPYGTGQLYENILNISKKICSEMCRDAMYIGDKETVSACHFIGATSNYPQTAAIKLYAPFRPFTQSSPDWVRLFILQGYCGNKSRIVEVAEEYIKEENKRMNDLGIASEYSGSAALGLLMQMKDQIPRDAKIIIINTGKAKIGLY